MPPSRAVAPDEQLVAEAVSQTRAPKFVQGLTPQQAAWKPDGAKHSIWQIVMHMSFWREFVLRELAGESRDEQEIARRNWPEPKDITDAAWQEAVEYLVKTQAQITAAMRESDEKTATLRNFIEHASYHMGQIIPAER